MKINGSLIFDASSASEIRNLKVEKVSSLPTWGSTDVGRLLYNTTNNKLYQGNNSAWIEVGAGSSLSLTGGTVTGNIVMSGATVQVPAPTGGTDATNKTYVDNLISGLAWKQSVKAATTANIAGLQAALAAGQIIDGVTLVLGDRVLVKNQTTASANGIYISGPTLTRANDALDASSVTSMAVFVQQGTVNADTAWTQTASVSTIDTDALVFVQFAGGTYTPGNGSITNAMLQNSSVNINADTGGISVDLGGDLLITGDISYGMETTASSGSVVIKGKIADNQGQRGVASYNSAHFDVSNVGVVSITNNAIALDNLSDVAISSPVIGQSIVHDGSGFVNKKTYHVYTGSSATTHTVSHGIGQKFCQVTVSDASDEVIIPSSIKFDSTTQLTVTFNTATACTVSVMGIPT